MNRSKRFFSALLAAVMLLSVMPFGVFATEPRAITVPLHPGMTVDEACVQLNLAAGLAEQTTGWTYQALAKLEYTYTKIEVNAGDVMPGMTWMDVTPYLPSYPDLLAEAENQLTIKESSDAAATQAFVPIAGQKSEIAPFVYQLAEKVSYMGYTAGCRATLQGTKTYEALDLSRLPRRVTMENGGQTYTVTFTKGRPVTLVEAAPGTVYRVSAGGDAPDFAALTAEAVLDGGKSVFGDAPYDAKNLTLMLFDEASGSYQPLSVLTPTLGETYRVKLTYATALYEASVEVQAVYTDNRSVASATLSGNRIDVMGKGDAQAIETSVFDLLLTLEGTKGELTADDLAFEYYGVFDYTPLFTSAIGQALKEELRRAIAETFVMASYDTLTGMSAEEFVSTTITDEWLNRAFRFETWVPFTGGQYTITETVGEHQLGLGVITLPAIGSGEYRIRVRYAGSNVYFPFGAESEGAILRVHPTLADLSVSEAEGASASAPITRFDLSLTENKVYLTLPEEAELLSFRAGETMVDAGQLYLQEMKKALTLGTLIDLYETEIFASPLLADAFTGDTGVMQFLFDTYLIGAVRDWDLALGTPQAGHYLTFALIGNRAVSPDLAFGPATFGGEESGSYYIGLADGISVMTAEPTAQGQYYMVTFDQSHTDFTTMNQGVSQTRLDPAMRQTFTYDGMAHGMPMLWNGSAQIGLGDGDVVRYYNLDTGRVFYSAPSEAGRYFALAFHRAMEGDTTERFAYRFTIETAKVNVTLPSVDLVYGDALPEIKPSFGQGAPSVLPQYEILTPGYDGKPGVYPISIRIWGENPGYEYLVTEGLLTVTKRSLTVKVEDQTYTYGDEIALNYTVTEGSLPETLKGALVFDQMPKNAGVYTVSLLCEDESISLTVLPGQVTVNKQKHTLTIGSQTLLFGQEPVFTTTPAWNAIDADILYQIDGYQGAPGTYTVSATLSDTTNYDVTFVPGKVTFQKITMLMIDPGTFTVQWGDTPELKATAYAYVSGKLVEVPTVGLDYTFTAYDADGRAVDLNGKAELGTYSLRVKVSGTGMKHYPTPIYREGSLTVVKKQITVGIQESELPYGDQTYDPTAHLTVQSLPEGVNLTFDVPDYRALGSYTVTPVISGNYDTVHYEITAAPGTLTVVPRPITVIPTPGLHKLEGEADPTLGYTVDELKYGDVLNGAPAREEGEAVGEYAITLGTLAHECYVITLAPAVLTILPVGAMGIEITPPAKTEYLVGEALDLSDVEVFLLFAEDNKQLISLEDCVVRGYDPATVGMQTVTIDYQGFTAHFTVTVKSGEITFTDDRFAVEGEILCITSLSRAVRLADLLAALPEGWSAKLFKGETALGEEKYVGTGMTLQVFAGETLVKTLTLRVMGDVNGDGTLTQTDAVLALHHVSGKRRLEGEFALAADVAGSAGITVTDAARILRLVTTFER